MIGCDACGWFAIYEFGPMPVGMCCPRCGVTAVAVDPDNDSEAWTSALEDCLRSLRGSRRIVKRRRLPKRHHDAPAA